MIPIPNKSADTITKAFIRHYLPRHMCPQFILSDNGTEFKNQIFDKVTKDLGIERIFSAPYHPQSNGKLETFHKFLKPTLKKMCADDQDNWDIYIYIFSISVHTLNTKCLVIVLQLFNVICIYFGISLSFRCPHLEVRNPLESTIITFK